MINNFNLEKVFPDGNINGKVSLLNKTIFNFLNNYIPHETITCDNAESPSFNFESKTLIENKNKLRKKYRRCKTNIQSIGKLNLLQEQLSFLINIMHKWQANRLMSKETPRHIGPY